MNVKTVFFALCFGAVTLVAQEQQQEQRVQAKEPTVMTVQGTSERLNPEETVAQPRRRTSRFKLGGLKALTGAGNAAGWMLNVDDDIPSSRENTPRYRTDRRSR